MFLRAVGGWCGMEDLILRYCADGVNAEITTSMHCQNVANANLTHRNMTDAGDPPVQFLW